MDESSPFLICEDGDTLRIAWDNRGVRKENLPLRYVIMFSAFALFAVLCTYGILRPDAIHGDRTGLVIMCVFGWAAAFLIPLVVIIPRTWSEWIEISKESISH